MRLAALLSLQVNELQRRQRKDHEKEVKKREKLLEKEKAERAASAKLKMEEEAYQLQVCYLQVYTAACQLPASCTCLPVAHPLLACFLGCGARPLHMHTMWHVLDLSAGCGTRSAP
jgi:hypothetical protein